MKTRNKQDQRQPEHPDLMMRAATIETRPAEGEEPAQVRMSVSSETPVMTLVRDCKAIPAKYPRIKDERGNMQVMAYEILDHSEGSVNMFRCKDGLVVLDDHKGDQIGLLAVELVDRKLGGPVQFCSGQRAQDISTDAARGLRRNTSAGYLVNAEAYRFEGEQDGFPVVRAMSWTPYDASFVPIPADTTVGVNRAAKTPAAKPAPTKEDAMEPKEMQKLFARAAKFGISADAVAAIDMADGIAARAALDALIVEKQEVDLAKERKTVIELRERKPDAPVAATVPVQGPEIGMTVKETRRYSIANAIRCQIPNSGIDGGFERECSQEVARKLGKSARGLFVPFDVQVAKRDLQIAGAGTGSNMVATNLMAGDFITALRANMALEKLGVKVLSGLSGDIAIPKGAAVTATWGTETADADEVTPVLSQVTGTPKTVKARTNISRKLIMQSSVDIEAFVQNELAIALAVAIDKSAFNGAGTAEPVGLLTGPCRRT
jgi:HK97 family phage major capsid protein